MSTFEQRLFNAIRPQRSRVKKSRRARRGPWRSEKYRRWIAGHSCLICGERGTQAAHTEHNGMASKGSDASCVPLCPRHHDQLDGREHLAIVHADESGNHAIIMPTRAKFEMWYGVDLKAQAAAYYSRWTAGEEPAPDPECFCRFSGDHADTSDCELHGVLRQPAVRLVMEDSHGDVVPF